LLTGLSNWWHEAGSTEALKLVDDTLAKGATSGRLTVLSAELKIRKGDKAGAAKMLDQLVTAPKVDVASGQRALALALRHSLKTQAENLVDGALKQRPKDPNSHLWKAILHRDSKEMDLAQEALGRALDLRNDFYPALGLLAQAGADGKPAPEYEKRLADAVSAGRTKDARIYRDYLELKKRNGVAPLALAEEAQRLVTSVPDLVPLRALAAELVLAAKGEAEASRLIEAGLTEQGKSPGMLELAARWAERRGQIGIASERFAQLSKQYPERVDLLIKRGQLLFGERKHEEAVKLFEAAVKLAPTDEFANRELAFALARSNQADAALLTAQRLAELPGARITGLLLKADVYGYAKNTGAARKLYAEAVRLQPDDRTLGAQIRFMDGLGEVKEADKVQDAWIARNPRSIPALTLATARAMGQEDYSRSIGFLARLLEQQPENPYLLNDLAWAQASLVKAEAEKNAQAALRALPNNPMVMDTLIFALQRAGKKSEALEMSRSLMKLTNDSPAATLRLSEVLAEAGEPAQAKDLASKLALERLSAPQKKRAEALLAKLK
jgi:cellulose synthase operon protein C